ncbi:hypothetical protein [uncultured Kordia sp.]|uniref:hypothetical protein n=1 Tax=uncultured Kordia sp. TaxID=507699 RepID=UPI002620983E|nr:hypothetical protein [uncultured Kordia sp.]
MRNLTEDELTLIRMKYKKNLKSFLFSGIWPILFVIAACTIPVHFFSRNASNAGMSGTLIGQGAIGFIIVLLVFIGIITYNYINSPFFSFYQDLQDKKKIIKRIRIKEIIEIDLENTSDYNLEKGYTHQIVYSDRIMFVPSKKFDKHIHPELLEATEMLIHYSEHSEIELVREIV